MSLTSIGNSILVLPRLEKLKINGKAVTFKTGLNILILDPWNGELPVIKGLAQGEPIKLLPRFLSGGELLMLLLTGLPELRMSGKSLVIYGVFEGLDKRNLRIALKLLSRTRNQLILVTHSNHFRKQRRVKANIITLARAQSWAFSSPASGISA